MKEFEVVSNENVVSVSFYQAMDLYKNGVLIECRMYDSDNNIVDWERYHISNGLEIALEFNEILNGKWFADKESLSWAQSGLSKWTR